MKIFQIGHDKFVIFLDQEELNDIEIPARLEIEKHFYDLEWSEFEDYDEDYDDGKL